VKVLLFAALREAAGSSRVDADAPTVGALLDELSARFGPAFDRVMRAGTVVVNGETAGREVELRPDDEVALLPPVSGGCVDTGLPVLGENGLGWA
jgi:MoaD family protein